MDKAAISLLAVRCKYVLLLNLANYLVRVDRLLPFSTALGLFVALQNNEAYSNLVERATSRAAAAATGALHPALLCIPPATLWMQPLPG